MGAEKKFHSSFTEVPIKAYSLGFEIWVNVCWDVSKSGPQIVFVEF